MPQQTVRARFGESENGARVGSLAFADQVFRLQNTRESMITMRGEVIAFVNLRLTRYDLVRSLTARAISSTGLSSSSLLLGVLAASFGLTVREAALATILCWAGLVVARVCYLAARTHEGPDGVLGESTLTVLPEGYRVEAGSSVSFHRWSDVMSVGRNRNSLRFSLGHARGHLIPAEALSSHIAFEALSVRAHELWKRSQVDDRPSKVDLPGQVMSEIRFEQSRASVRCFVRERLTCHVTRGLVRVVLGCAAVLACACLWIASKFGVFVALSLALPFVLLGWAVKRAYEHLVSLLARRVSTHQLGKVRVALAPEGVLRSTDHGGELIPWTRVEAVGETSSFIVMGLSAGEAIAIPKDAFQAPEHSVRFASQADELRTGRSRSRERTTRFSTHPPPALA